MNMNDGKREVSKELAWDDWKAYNRISRHTRNAKLNLRLNWQQAGRNPNVARAALWFAVVLDGECAEALEPGHKLRLWPPGVSSEIRYGLQAGIRMVHATLPFTAVERATLQEPLNAFRDGFPPKYEPPELLTYEPELVARWHDWLWQDELGLPQTDVARLGASAVLAESCGQLAATIDTIMADPLVDPM